MNLTVKAKEAVKNNQFESVVFRLKKGEKCIPEDADPVYSSYEENW